MQDSMVDGVLSSRLEEVSQRSVWRYPKLADLFENTQYLNRLATHLIVLAFVIGAIAIGGFGLSQRPLVTPPYTPLDLTDSPVETVTDNGRPLTLSGRVREGGTILRPAAAPFTIIPDRSAYVARVEEIQTYEVQSGDTIYGIALAFGLAPETVMWANGDLQDNPDLLRLGQELVILPVNGVYHQVGSGDTIEGIASAFKVEPETVINYHLNNLDVENPIIVPGQWLIVPDGVKPYVPRYVSAAANNAPSSAQQGTGILQWPASGNVTQDFWSGHRALDIDGWDGSPVYAADSGYVVSAQWDDSGYGRMVVIDHGNGFKSMYAHLSVYYVSIGDEVAGGQQIAEMGSTGNSTGPHLHFELLLDDVKRNPWGFLP